MIRFIKIFSILIIVLFIFNKKIISFYYVNKLSNWVERPVSIKNVRFNYSGLIELSEVQIKNSKDLYFENIFEAGKITLKINVKSIFSDLVIVEELSIQDPKFYLDIKIKNKDLEDNIQVKVSEYEDNIGLAKKINEEIPDKIWPKKRNDKNFIVMKSSLFNAHSYIKISTITGAEKISLSDMKFSNFGNEKKYRHYKDVLKFILFDIFASAKNSKIKQILKKVYNL